MELTCDNGDVMHTECEVIRIMQAHQLGHTVLISVFANLEGPNQKTFARKTINVRKMVHT